MSSASLFCPNAVLLSLAEYLKERMTKLTEESIDHDGWLDFTHRFQSVISLRTEMDSEAGQAVLDCICLDEDVLRGLGAAKQMADAIFTDGRPPERMLALLKVTGAHLQQHEYEYRRKLVSFAVC